MKSLSNCIVKIASLCVTVALTLFVATACSQAEQAGAYRLVYVQDGDSVVLCCERSKKFTVRLLDIDAPERYQPYAKKSRALLKNLLEGEKLKLLGDKYDRYGRRLAIIEVGGDSINEKMVSSGAAWVWKYSKNRRMRSLQQEAKERKLGLWALPEEQRQDPSDWRKTHPRK